MSRAMSKTAANGNGVEAGRRLIESDSFPFEFVSELAEMESWRKEVHRPVYHIHKWWAKRLGSVFRAVLLGSVLPETENLAEAFYRQHDFSGADGLRPVHGERDYGWRGAQAGVYRAGPRHQPGGL